MVTRHAIILNPALSVREERYEVIEGKTPEITVPHARRLLASIDTATVVGRRQPAPRRFLRHRRQWMLRFEEKGGKSREIPVRHDLQQMIAAYIEAAGLQQAPQGAPLFRAAVGNSSQLADSAIHVNDICRMMKRRLKDAYLPSRLSPHSLRVAVITDLLEQGVSLEEVQRLAGHADPRTTRHYDRRQQKITRNIVERISI